MQQLTVLRPLVTAGTAAVGASLIALTPAVSHDLAADLQHSAATVQQRAVELASTDYAVNPIQTWIDVFTNSVANLQTVYNDWSQIPAVLLQQLAANWMQYASLYIGSYQAAANSALTFYTGTNPPLNIGSWGSGAFWLNLASALTNIQSGNLTQAVNNITWAFPFGPIYQVLQPLENILNIPIYLTQNLASATYDILANPGTDPSSIKGLIVGLGAFVLFPFSGDLNVSLGGSLQAAYDAFAAGNVLDGVLNLLNTPGAVANALLNGIAGGDGSGITGILTGLNGFDGGTGLVPLLVNLFPGFLASNIVAPGATNITDGGSLAATFQALLTQLATGWPTPQEWVDSTVNLVQTYFGVGGLTGAASAVALPVDFSAVAPSFAAGVAGIAPSIAADFSAVAPSIATNIAGTLAPELGALAAHLLTSLF
ncbi:hypothetical protein K3U93_14420 [Mycobacterium malmoense]|uniref:PE-PGRS family protein n=1 Tax=Mycobacterium malmoense TaxID=1780 RepID=A0ABX3SKU0_MYCMA|nr:hypothetical protein [Mycobacterium malmoense]OIN82471.1 hypothetical protein BMG05_02090 [Mycobacterium malmoense]ORA77824.1 hypothetical protein BST29_22810 [Mycobacterium malmoense]QZA15936.1 hypothetical protein K3U93_14420 [Mycobacterium malmoense]UNB92749.1 hypothetical protein H5T25_14410 [Mycobacterium malmoense]